RRTVFEPTKHVVVLAKLMDPIQGLRGGGSRRPAISSNSVPKSAASLAIPDPTPADPEPIRRPDVSLTPPIVHLTGDDLSVGVIGPPTDLPGQTGNGVRDQTGGDFGDVPGGTGEALNGPDISLPVLINHRLPQYTDEAIKARVEGVVFLQAVIRKNGRADSFQIVRGLGHGLDERAIQEIARSWTFRPATRRGVAIDYPTLIEVTFSLR
ncbi:MAG: energy transducer TonB, partial [Acidobacteria bacterium]